MPLIFSRLHGKEISRNRQKNEIGSVASIQIKRDKEKEKPKHVTGWRTLLCKTVSFDDDEHRGAVRELRHGDFDDFRPCQAFVRFFSNTSKVL